ncbi:MULTISPECIES: RagB/SusD family nutrient uptake outer membrane protein [Sphingobacterium]|uniref:RagB/SusD family nutrient uptake outer membrane protein n=1 Tax=Sphingobacterium TaxID=28453 RepID=UPI0013DA600E|nr:MULTISPECIES: RagB/SusD family nutrient uptake outer membrane protein [unclassified Sphingobacterium]
MNVLKYGACLLLWLITSCQNEWLDVKPVQSMVIPTKVADYEAILDNVNIMNSSYLGIGEVASADFHIADDFYARLIDDERIAYLWKSEPTYSSNMAGDWTYAYQRILRSNIVLDGLVNLKEEVNTSQWKELKGVALFYRAFNYFQLAQVFTPPYATSVADKELGLPLRLTANVNQNVGRSTLEDLYVQVLDDLMQATDLLPLHTISRTRPSKVTAYALLSRIYLSTSDYDNALVYADSCLLEHNSLMDFNGDVDINLQLTNPIKQLNKETLFLARIGNYSAFSPGALIVDASLYRLYGPHDLRKNVFFREHGGVVRYKGSYDGTRLLFCGLSTGEILLNRAECYIRKGLVDLALADLNALLKARIDKGSFVPFAITDKDILLKEILLERRKELCFRGLRWSDLRRLNQDPTTEILLTREVLGSRYELLPRSARYTFAIPNQEVLLTGVEQNN